MASPSTTVLVLPGKDASSPPLGNRRAQPPPELRPAFGRTRVPATALRDGPIVMADAGWHEIMATRGFHLRMRSYPSRIGHSLTEGRRRDGRFIPSTKRDRGWLT